MEKKELTVRDLIKELLEFNMDAKVTINITGVPFPLYSDFYPCWSAFEGECIMYQGEWLDTRKNSTEVTFDFTQHEIKK